MNFNKERLKLITDTDLLIYDFYIRYPFEKECVFKTTQELSISLNEKINTYPAYIQKEIKRIYMEYHYIHFLGNEEQKEVIIKQIKRMEEVIKKVSKG